MTPIPARARVGQPLAGHCGQSERVVEFTVGEQTGIGGDHRSAKLEHQTSVEIDPEPIHPPGSPWSPHSIQNNMLIMLGESRSLRRKLVRHPGDADLCLVRGPFSQRSLGLLQYSESPARPYQAPLAPDLFHYRLLRSIVFG
jgi:hypothetical protein